MAERLDGFDNYSTETIYVNGRKVCVYCENEWLVIDDRFDEYGGYCGTRNYCTCEQAKIEQEMKRELEKEYEKELEIRKKYKDKLKVDKSKIARLKVKELFINICRDYVKYGDLFGCSFEDLSVILKEAYDEEVYGE